jgi:hypothetical protein
LAIKSSTNIDVGASLYVTPTNNDIFFSLASANIDTCLNDKTLSDNTIISALNSTSFTLAPKPESVFLEPLSSTSINCTIKNDYKRIP